MEFNPKVNCAVDTQDNNGCTHHIILRNGQLFVDGNQRDISTLYGTLKPDYRLFLYTTEDGKVEEIDLGRVCNNYKADITTYNLKFCCHNEGTEGTIVYTVSIDAGIITLLGQQNGKGICNKQYKVDALYGTIKPGYRLFLYTTEDGKAEEIDLGLLRTICYIGID